MTLDPERHVPTPVFRAALEHELRAALRAEEPIALAMRERRRARWRAAALIAVGLFFGTGIQLASAQVRDARARSVLDSALAEERAVAALRVEVARAAHELARAGFETGALSRQSLLEAAAVMRAAEMELGRADLNAAEARASADVPRDELWAPLVDGRDFVHDRLILRAGAAQQRLTAAEHQVAEAQRGYQVGAVTQHALADLEFEAAQAKREFQVLAQRLQLRLEFLRDGLPANVVTRRARDIELTFDIMRVQQLLERAKARVAWARERTEVGAAVALDVKRAEIEVLERTIELDRLVRQLRGTSPPEP